MKTETAWVVVLKRKDGHLISGMFDTVQHVRETQAQAVQEFIKQETKHGEYCNITIQQQIRNKATGETLKVVDEQ